MTSRAAFIHVHSIRIASGDEVLTEEASFNPVTPYAVSKIRSEESISKLADVGLTV